MKWCFFGGLSSASSLFWMTGFHKGLESFLCCSCLLPSYTYQLLQCAHAHAIMRLYQSPSRQSHETPKETKQIRFWHALNIYSYCFHALLSFLWWVGSLWKAEYDHADHELVEQHDWGIIFPVWMWQRWWLAVGKGMRDRCHVCWDRLAHSKLFEYPISTK